jgi:telomerase reverse transcriptase
MMDYATSTAKASAFSRAVLHELIPHGFWGTEEVQCHNQAVFYRNVDRFIGLRRFETLSLHEVSQGMKVMATMLSA